MKVSLQMRDVLIDHIDGPVAVRRHTTRNRAVVALVDRGLLRPHPPGCSFPHFTAITETGRGILAKILGDWADAITRARFRAADRTFAGHTRLADSPEPAPIQAAQ